VVGCRGRGGAGAEQVLAVACCHGLVMGSGFSPPKRSRRNLPNVVRILSSRFCSHTVHAPEKPNAVRSHS
jgi:hypothetical protein